MTRGTGDGGPRPYAHSMQLSVVEVVCIRKDRAREAEKRAERAAVNVYEAAIHAAHEAFREACEAADAWGLDAVTARELAGQAGALSEGIPADAGAHGADADDDDEGDTYDDGELSADAARAETEGSL